MLFDLSFCYFVFIFLFIRLPTNITFLNYRTLQLRIKQLSNYKLNEKTFFTITQ